jgi:hypothetical protein
MVNILNNKKDSRNPERTNKVRSSLFKAGIFLIAISFLVYPFYLIIPFLTVSLHTKTMLFFTGLVFSWGLFGTGGLIAGKEGYPILKAAIKKIFY